MIYLPFEKPRDVVENGGDDDHPDGEPGVSASSNQIGGLPRPTDSQVAVDGDEQHDPDGQSLSNGRHRPCLWLNVDEQLTNSIGHPIGESHDGLIITNRKYSKRFSKSNGRNIMLKL